MSSTGVIRQENMVQEQKNNISDKLIEVLKNETFRTNIYRDNSSPLSAKKAIEILELTINRINSEVKSYTIKELFKGDN